jgi:hypothetical protein
MAEQTTIFLLNSTAQDVSHLFSLHVRGFSFGFSFFGVGGCFNGME